jgi:hypothetical protein
MRRRGKVALEDVLRRKSVTRRTALKTGLAAAVASQAAVLEQLAVIPNRQALAASTPSDIQFDIGAFIAPAQTFSDGGGNVVAQFGPVFTLFVPAKLTRTPTRADQTTLANALNTIEANFPFSPSGVMIASVSYGVPYFNRLPGGINGTLVQQHMPHLLSGTNPDGTTNVLAEAVAGPTDVVNGKVQGANNPPAKERFNVDVAIESNDVLFQLRSDSLSNLENVVDWVQGSNTLNGNSVQSPDFGGLFDFQTLRLQFVQPGLPRKVADAGAQKNAALFEFNGRINPDSSMVMSFVDQQVDSSAPTADVVTFQGSSHGVFTTAKAGDYFDNGSIAHFSHVIDDLYQFYQTAAQDPTGGGGEPASERIQYMFRSNQINSGFQGLPVQPNTDEFTNGGAPAFVNNVFQGTNAARLGAIAADGTATQTTNTDPNKTFNGQQRIGHEVALQQTSRAADGTPLHIRNDGPGLDGMDVPAFDTFPGQPSISTHFDAGTVQFKLQFLIFVPTSEFFRQLRISAGAQALFAQFGQPNDPNGTSGGVQFADNGLERFLTATRRQNFLVPPRRHRAFPLVELT